jgi:uncharacterized membrane protein YhaH (DUF805 family)
MKWIYFFFGNLDGRIGRQTFWIASIAVMVIAFVIATVAGSECDYFLSNIHAPPLAAVIEWRVGHRHANIGAVQLNKTITATRLD